MGKVTTVLTWAAGLVAGLFALYLLVNFAIPYSLAPDSLNRVEAQALLDSELRRYRQKQYPALALLVGKSERRRITGQSGAGYQLSTWIPMTDSFILSPSGKFIGE